MSSLYISLRCLPVSQPPSMHVVLSLYNGDNSSPGDSASKPCLQGHKRVRTELILTFFKSADPWMTWEVNEDFQPARSLILTRLCRSCLHAAGMQFYRFIPTAYFEGWLNPYLHGTLIRTKTIIKHRCTVHKLGVWSRFRNPSFLLRYSLSVCSGSRSGVSGIVNPSSNIILFLI